MASKGTPGDGSVRTVIIGNSGVGKTSLISAFVRGKPDQRSKPTVGAVFYSYEGPEVGGGRRVLMQIWDTAGQELYASLSQLYYRNARVALCVFDVTSEDSLDSITRWCTELRKHAPDAIVYLIGNKIDLRRPENLDREKIDAKAAEVQCRSVHFASALTLEGLRETFTKVIDDVVELKLYLEPGAVPAESTGGGCC